MIATELLADRIAVEAVLQRYARCLDDFDYDGVRDVFTEDAAAQYNQYPELAGGQAVADFLRERTAGTTWQHHQLTVVEVTVDGDGAHAVTYFNAHRVGADPDEVVINVGHYHDTLRRTPDGWRICDRRQRTGWKETRRR